MVELADDTLDNDCTGGDLTAAAGPGYYVDQANGACSDSDIGRGSKAKPYCTLEKAVIDAYQAVPSSDPQRVLDRALQAALVVLPVHGQWWGTPSAWSDWFDRCATGNHGFQVGIHSGCCCVDLVHRA
jgi:hypothetical protein